MLSKEQYEFTNMFWNDPEWDEQLPKYYEIDENDNVRFHYLNKQEIKDFIRYKAKEELNLIDMSFKKLELNNENTSRKV